MDADELRARVATEVMHWHQEPGPDDRMYYTSAVGKFVMPVAEWDPLDDANHRDMVVQAMRAKGWDVVITSLGVSPPYHVALCKGARRHSCSDQLGYAVIRAALAAVEGEC